jgi:hypothetical protein
MYANLPTAFGTLLLAYETTRTGGLGSNCLAKELSANISEYRRVLLGNNGAQAVGLFNVSYAVQRHYFAEHGAPEQFMAQHIPLAMARWSFYAAMLS